MAPEVLEVGCEDIGPRSLEAHCVPGHFFALDFPSFLRPCPTDGASSIKGPVREHVLPQVRPADTPQHGVWPWTADDLNVFRRIYSTPGNLEPKSEANTVKMGGNAIHSP